MICLHIPFDFSPKTWPDVETLAKFIHITMETIFWILSDTSQTAQFLIRS